MLLLIVVMFSFVNIKWLVEKAHWVFCTSQEIGWLGGSSLKWLMIRWVGY